MNSILKITDGSLAGTIDLLDINVGYLLNDWKPAIVPMKGGGVWQSSPLVDGRRLAMRHFDNAIETFDVKLKGDSNQDDAIAYLQKLVTLLEKASAYWTATWQYEPVWIEARGATETNIRYAVIRGYTLEGLNNPFSQPFFAGCSALIDNFTIILERDHWLDHQPGTQHCVNLATVIDVPDTDSYNTGTFPIGGATDDVTVTRINGVLNGYLDGIDEIDIGTSGLGPPLGTYEAGLRFPSVTIPNNAVIVNAYIQVVNYGTEGDDTHEETIDIHGENTDDADTFSASNYEGRYNNKTINSTSYYSAAGTWGSSWGDTYDLDVTSIVQSIVSRGGWVSGNGMAFFLEFRLQPTSYGDEIRRFASYENTDYDPAKLVIEYTTATKEVGQPSTCTDGIFIANKQSNIRITDIFRYWPGGASYVDIYTDNKLFTGNYTVLYICCSLYGGSKFTSITANLAVAAALDATFEWQYYNGGGYTDLPDINGNTQFQGTGNMCVYWEYPTNWAVQTLNGVTGYWIKVVQTSGGVIPADTAIVDGTEIFTIITPGVKIDAADVPGEIASLARVRILAYDYCDGRPDTLVVMGLRSLSRGLLFTPYLNFNFYYNPPGIYAYPLYASAWTSDTNSPNGDYAIACPNLSTINYDFLDSVAFGMTNPVATQYRGLFHAYLRCKQVGGTAGDIGFRLKIFSSIGSEPNYSQIAYTDYIEGGWTSTYGLEGANLLDLGIVSLGNSDSLTVNDEVYASNIYVQYISLSTDSIVVKLYDLILMPVDEWAGVYSTNTNDLDHDLWNQRLLDVDATSSLRTQRAVLKLLTTEFPDISNAVEYYHGEWIRQARGGPILQANADQRMWFLTALKNTGDEYYCSYFNIPHSIRVYRNSRYLTMRGTI